jgi:hypothetical protein
MAGLQVRLMPDSWVPRRVRPLHSVPRRVRPLHSVPRRVRPLHSVPRRVRPLSQSQSQSQSQSSSQSSSHEIWAMWSRHIILGRGELSLALGLTYWASALVL